jgi:hypothetical protein
MNQASLVLQTSVTALFVLFGGCDRTAAVSVATVVQGVETPPTTVPSSERVRESYSQFAQALQERDAPAASRLVTKNTIDTYERCRVLALDSSKVDFEQLTQFEVLLAFQLRYLLSREKLASMNGQQVFCWGVAEGLVKQDTVKGISLNNVQVDGNVALATLRKNGQPAPGQVFRFVNEEGKWKLDLMHIIPGFEKAFKEVRDKAKKSKIELAVYLLERTYNQEIPYAILDGPLK